MKANEFNRRLNELLVNSFSVEQQSAVRAVVDLYEEYNREQVETDVEEMVDTATEELVEGSDFRDAVKEVVEEVLEDTSFEDAIDEAISESCLEDRIEDGVERHLRGLDLTASIEEAVKDVDLTGSVGTALDDIGVTEHLENLQAEVDQLKAVARGGFWVRMRWLLTGR